jgi:uncharacterized protein YjbI with pentapeptide repeats
VKTIFLILFLILFHLITITNVSEQLIEGNNTFQIDNQYFQSDISNNRIYQEYSNLTNSTLGDQDFENFHSWRYFVNTSMNKPSFTDADLNNVNLTNIDLTNADLRYANLSYASLERADLTNADLIDTDLTNTDIRNATFNQTVLNCTSLKTSNLDDKRILQGILLADSEFKKAKFC